MLKKVSLVLLLLFCFQGCSDTAKPRGTGGGLGGAGDNPAPPPKVQPKTPGAAS